MESELDKNNTPPATADTTKDSLISFLRRLNLTQYESSLIQNGFDSLMNLRHCLISDLTQDCGIPIGHARRIIGELRLPEKERVRETMSSQDSSSPGRLLVEHYTCPICYELFVSPRTLPCGHTFCFHCVERWKAQSEAPLCPVDRRPMPDELPECNILVNDAIKEWFPIEHHRREAEVSTLRHNHAMRTYRYLFTRNHENATMLQQLCETGVLSCPELETAMLWISRAEFLPPSVRHEAFDLQPVRISSLCFNVSSPVMQIMSVQALNVQCGDVVLDVGAGSGLTTALLAQLATETGRVDGIDLNESIIRFCSRNLDMQHSRITRMLADYQAKYPVELGGHEFLPGNIFTGQLTYGPSSVKATFIVDRRPTSTTLLGRIVAETAERSRHTFVRGEILQNGLQLRLIEAELLYLKGRWFPQFPCIYEMLSDTRATPAPSRTLRYVGEVMGANETALAGFLDLRHRSNNGAGIQRGNIFLSYAETLWPARAEPRLKPLCFDNIRLFVGNVLRFAKRAAEPVYDKIHIAAACTEDDMKLIGRTLLKRGGSMVTPIEDELFLIVKDSTTEELSKSSLTPANFGELVRDDDAANDIDPYEFLPNLCQYLDMRTEAESQDRVPPAQYYYTTCCSQLVFSSTDVEDWEKNFRE